MAALGLICVVASGSCWAQQSTSSTNDKPAVKAATVKPAQKSASKPVAKKTTEAKNGKSSKDAKRTKSAAKGKTSKADEDKVASAEAVVEKTADKTSSARPDTKVADRSGEKSSDKTAADKAITAKTDVAPPAGTMMGAYGQSLMRPSASTTAAVTTVAAAGTAATLVAGTQNTPAATPVPSTATALPPTALMGAAAGNANAGDAVTRFLQQRGIVAQAQVQTGSGAEPASPGLLNKVRDNASDLVLSAMNFLGVPYKRGGNSVNNGFDCSGFTRHIFEMSVGLVLPRRADEQAKLSSLVPIKKEELKPGDLVFFNTMRATFSHVGIYVGEGKFIHSPRVGGAVRVEDMREAYWAKRFTGARRADLNQTPGT